MAATLFTKGGGAGIGSYVVVFKDGRMADDTDPVKLRGAYESGEQIYFSIIDEETEEALVPASGWIDPEAKLHLVARDFDDGKTYSVTMDDAPGAEADIEYEVEEGITLGDEEIPSMEDVEEELSSKQDTLVSGENIKTINNQSILGSGNIDIQGGGGGADTEPHYLQIETHVEDGSLVVDSFQCDDLPANTWFEENYPQISIDFRITKGEDSYFQTYGAALLTYSDSETISYTNSAITMRVTYHPNFNPNQEINPEDPIPIPTYTSIIEFDWDVPIHIYNEDSNEIYYFDQGIGAEYDLFYNTNTLVPHAVTGVEKITSQAIIPALQRKGLIQEPKFVYNGVVFFEGIERFWIGDLGSDEVWDPIHDNFYAEDDPFADELPIVVRTGKGENEYRVVHDGNVYPLEESDAPQMVEGAGITFVYRLYSEPVESSEEITYYLDFYCNAPEHLFTDQLNLAYQSNRIWDLREWMWFTEEPCAIDWTVLDENTDPVSREQGYIKLVCGDWISVEFTSSNGTIVYQWESDGRSLQCTADWSHYHLPGAAGSDSSLVDEIIVPDLFRHGLTQETIWEYENHQFCFGYGRYDIHGLDEGEVVDLITGARYDYDRKLGNALESPLYLSRTDGTYYLHYTGISYPLQQEVQCVDSIDGLTFYYNLYVDKGGALGLAFYYNLPTGNVLAALEDLFYDDEPPMEYSDLMWWWRDTELHGGLFPRVTAMVQTNDGRGCADAGMIIVQPNLPYDLTCMFVGSNGMIQLHYWIEQIPESDDYEFHSEADWSQYHLPGTGGGGSAGTPLPEVYGRLTEEMFVPLDEASGRVDSTDWTRVWNAHPDQVLLHLEVDMGLNRYAPAGDYILTQYVITDKFTTATYYKSQVTSDGCELILNDMGDNYITFQWTVSSLCCYLPVPESIGDGLWVECEIRDLDSVSVADVPELEE